MQSRWNTWPQQPHAMDRPGWSGSPVGLAWYSMLGSYRLLRQMAHVSVQICARGGARGGGTCVSVCGAKHAPAGRTSAWPYSWPARTQVLRKCPPPLPRRRAPHRPRPHRHGGPLFDLKALAALAAAPPALAAGPRLAGLAGRSLVHLHLVVRHGRPAWGAGGARLASDSPGQREARRCEARARCVAARAARQPCRQPPALLPGPTSDTR